MTVFTILQHPAEGEDTKPPILYETSCLSPNVSLSLRERPLPPGEAR